MQEAKKVMEAVEKINPVIVSSENERYLGAGFYVTMGKVYTRLGDNEKLLNAGINQLKTNIVWVAGFAELFYLKS